MLCQLLRSRWTSWLLKSVSGDDPGPDQYHVTLFKMKWPDISRHPVGEMLVV